MNDILQGIYFGKCRDKFVLLRNHYRHMSDGSLVFVVAHYRRKWGTRM